MHFKSEVEPRDRKRSDIKAIWDICLEQVLEKIKNRTHTMSDGISLTGEVQYFLQSKGDSAGKSRLPKGLHRLQDRT